MTRTFEIAFPEMKRNLVKRTLLPLFGFREPEHLTLGISQRTLSAKIFLAANFNELVHALHSCVKPISVADHSRVWPVSPLHFVAQKEVTFLSPLQRNIPVTARLLWHTKCRRTQAGDLAPGRQRFLRTVIMIGSDIAGGMGIGRPLSATASAVHS